MQGAKNKLSDNLSIISRTLDIVGLFILGVLCHFTYSHSFNLQSEYRALLIINSLLVFVIFPNFNLYFSWRGRSRVQRSISVIYAWWTVLISLLIIFFTLKTSTTYSRIWFFSWGIVGTFYLVFYRYFLDTILDKLRSKGMNRKKILVYGAGNVGNQISQNLQNNYEIGYDIIAFLDDNEKLVGQKLNGIDIKHPSELLKILESCQELWIALPLRADKKVMDILHQTRHLTCIVRFIPDIYNFRLLNHAVTEIANIPMIDINGIPMSTTNRFFKRLEDIIISLIILICISPIFLTIMLLVKLTSSGPIFYKQLRHGWNGKPIKVYKFRSMHYCPQDKFVQATKSDPRITKIGKFIRSTSIDEFPQFINVLQGRMSIVGPRPHPLQMNEEYKDRVDKYMQRHKVKPGITGLAQIKGFRGETDTIDKMEKRIEYDLYYIENWSLLLDFKIIFLTIFKGFIGKNAY